MLLSNDFTLRLYFFFCKDPPTTETYTLSLHDALPIFFPPPLAGEGRVGATACARPRGASSPPRRARPVRPARADRGGEERSEEHTSELQSRFDLVCRLLLEKKK